MDFFGVKGKSKFWGPPQMDWLWTQVRATPMKSLKQRLSLQRMVRACKMPLYGNTDKQKVWYWFESKQELYVLLSHTSTAPFRLTLSLSNKEIRVSLFVLIPTNRCCYSYHWYLWSIGASAIVLRCSIPLTDLITFCLCSSI